MAHSIAVNGLSKQFVIGKSHTDTTLRERLTGFLRAPFRRRRDEEATIWALRDVSFSIAEGEVVGIIGRNGAGKSTLLKILSKITFPTSGSIQVKGRTAALLEVGTGFHEELSGRENVYLNGSILGMKKREVDAKFDAIVDFAGVEQFVDTPIKRYSSGMRLRLGFAVAAHLDPDILIVDEVLAVGDAGFQKKCLNVMGDLRRAGRTVLFVSHNMAAVENLCSRAIWIDGGQVRSDGPAQAIIQSYMASFATNDAAAAELPDPDSRGGTGDIRLTRLEFLSTDRQPKALIRSGDSLVLRFHYHAKKPVLQPSFGFRLFTELGTLVTETGTWQHALDIPLVPAGTGYLDLEIDLLNLLPARYSMSLSITGVSQIVHDMAEHCTRLEVDISNIYRASRVVDARWGVVYFPQRWDLSGIGDGSQAPRAAGSSAEAKDQLTTVGAVS